jgi:cation:H+ antiporter
MAYIHVLFLIGGLILLVKGSDYFVESASRIAKRLGVSEFVIGLTLVALGTSVPELSTAITASIKKDSGLIIGNVIGSNIANIGLVLGIGALIATLAVNKTIFKRDGYLMMSAAIIFYLLAYDNNISGAEGILFLSIYISYNIFIITSSKSKKVYNFSDFLDYYLKFKYITTIRSRLISKEIKKPSSFPKKDRKKSAKIRDSYEAKKEYQEFKGLLVKDFLIFIISTIAIIYGASLLVSESIWFAESLGISTTIIGITIIAIGTSVPELMVTIKSALKGYSEMAIGNVLGSNIANILLILGVSSLIHPININGNILNLSAPFMIFISGALIFMMRTKWKIEKREGIFLLLLYTIFIALLLLL